MKLPKRTYKWIGLGLALIAGLAVWLLWWPAMQRAVPAGLPSPATVSAKPAVVESTAPAGELPAETPPPPSPAAVVASPTAAVPAPALASSSSLPTSRSLTAPEQNGNPAEVPPLEERASAPLQPDGLESSARMYAAHAPLRTPEVADPDSATNKKIMQTMVLKALRTNTPEPTQFRRQEDKQ